MAKTEEQVVTTPEAMHDAASILAGLDIAALVRGQVEELVNQRMAEESQKVSAGNQTVLAETRSQAPVPEARYLKHYRCDKSPNVVIFARSIVDGKPFRQSEWSTDAKQFRNRDPLEGQKILFRRGHFFATEQWQVDLLDWMMGNPLFSPGGDTINPQVLGGDPHIYEDDGKMIGACPECGEPFIPGSNALKAHLRATHGITV